MSRLFWDTPGSRVFETGIDRVVLYLYNPNSGLYDYGIPWNGVKQINESDNGYSFSPIYADNIKYLNLIAPSDLQLSIEAYTYPEVFALLNGSVEVVDGMTISQQIKMPFGLSYRTRVGNDLDGDDFGYKIHLIYGCVSVPSDMSYQTVNDSPEAVSFNWTITTTPVPVSGFKPISEIIIDSRSVVPKKMTLLLDQLYGFGDIVANLPLPDVIFDILETKPMLISPVDPDEEIGHMETSNIQEDVSITTNLITGSLKPLSWLFDPFSFKSDMTTGTHYYLALDFSNNDFEQVTLCSVGVRLDNMHDVFAREDHKVLIDVRQSDEILYVVRGDLKNTYVQMFDLSGLTFLSE